MENFDKLNDLFEYDPKVLKTTTKKEYLDRAVTFWDTYGPVFENFAATATSSDNPSAKSVSDLVSYILDLAAAHLPNTIFKSKKNMQNMDDALFIVTFVLPALVSYDDNDIGVSLSFLPEDTDKKKISECLKELASALASSWGERFQVTPLGIATTLELANGYEEHFLKRGLAHMGSRHKK